MGRNNGYLKASSVPQSDECLTPRYGVEPVIKYLSARGYLKIWCPFDNSNSQYVRCLQGAGFIVHCTTLKNGYDFLEYEPRFFDYDCIVSNAPFSIKDLVLSRLYRLGKPFAVLLPQNSLQSIERVNLYLENGLEYLGFDRRICFYTRGELQAWKPSNHFASGYFCKDVLPEKMIFERLTPIQEPHYAKEAA